MIKRKFKQLVGLKKEDFDNYVKDGQIKLQNARLIPALKTGDEMALTSILLSSLRLVKEFRDNLFKDLKLSRSGKFYFFSEVSFPDIENSRMDGLILIVKSGVIKEAAFLEMKNKNNGIDADQIIKYIDLSKKLGVKTLATISNEFVSDPSHSPVDIRVPKSISMFHFSWTYIITQAQLLLFKNETNIEDEDQVEIMKEVLFYMENPISGISGYTKMKQGWKELSDKIRAQVPLKSSDKFISDAVVSWHEEEKDMALLLSRKLGVLVKSSPKSKDSIKNDIKKICKENCINGSLSIKNSVSDIKIICEFERRSVIMSNKIIPPLNKGTIGRISWINRQLENCRKKEGDLFNSLENKIWIEANIKFARENLKVKFSEIEHLQEIAKGKEIQAFNVVLIDGLGASFASPKKFIELIEKMILCYYEGIVQHMSNWKKPAPKLNQID